MVLGVLGHAVRIHCSDSGARAALASIFSTLGATKAPPTSRVLDYAVTVAADLRYGLQAPGLPFQTAADLGELVFLFERSLVVELQRGNPSLLFLHAAALAWEGQACLLVADSGGGKSTTTFALLQHGFSYLSDELAPIDLDSMRVLGYPHALCLKQGPPPPYALPLATLPLGRTMHIPVAELHLAEAWETGRPVVAVFHISFKPTAEPGLHPMGAGECAARLYANALNALAHPAHGLDAVKRVAENVTSFAATTGDLTKSCAKIVAAMRTFVGQHRSASQ